MRMTFRYIIAILAAAVALSSCAKELPGSGPVTEEGERVISATFGSVSKSTLSSDGLKPVFSDGDLITVTNGTATQICTLSVNGSVSTFRTTLAGPLKAVYPKDAAVVSNNDITGVMVPSSQTGLFKDANIAKADITASSSSAVFHIQTAMLRFYVDASIEVKNITITGSLNIATEGSNLKEIVVDSDDAYIHTKTSGNPDPRLCYVAVLPCPNTGTGTGIAANELTFTSDTESQGIVTRTTTATLKAAGMYNAFIPYYITIGTQKWGYCNVGAFLPEDYGLYFGWGDLEGQTWTKTTNTWSAGGFGWSRDPANEGNSTYNAEAFNRQKATVCPGNVLALAYDTAHKFWGTDWRMPTGGSSTAEFNVLCGNTKIGTTLNGITGWEFKDGAGHKVFFPRAGIGDGTNGALNRVGEQANYWSSTLVSTDLKQAYYLHLYSKADVGNYDRVRAGSIRPIYNEFSVEGKLSDYGHKEFEGVPQDEPLTGVFTVSNGPDGTAGTSDDVKVKFSKGNLRYTLSTSQWSFFEHQYDCGADTYAGGHGAEISLFTWGKSFWSYVPDGTGYYEGVEDISGTSRDWGMGKWRTLTYDEWIYLLNSRSITEKSRGYAKVHLWNDRYGIIIFPDGYSTTVTSGNGIQTVWGEDFPTTMISEADWTVMENNGAVFLPAAGHREGDTIKFAQESDGYLHAEYWTSSLYYDTVEYASYITIGDNRDSSPKYCDFPGCSITSQSAFRSDGMSVRLVTDAAP